MSSNLRILRGNTATIGFQVLDPGAEPFNLTGATIAFDATNGTQTLSKTWAGGGIVVTEPLTGAGYVSIAPGDTSGWPAVTAPLAWTIKVTVSGNVYTVADGTLAVVVSVPPPAPTITSIDPVTGPIAGGTSVTINGTDLTNASAVTFGGVAATSYVVNSATRITAVAPVHAAGTVTISVTTPGGAVTAPVAFTYFAPPVPALTEVLPVFGAAAGGELVAITGTNLTGATQVTFGGVAATSFVVNSATSISAVAPAHAAAVVDVVVTTPGGDATLHDSYQFVAPTPLAVTSVSPGQGSTEGGQFVTIHGTAFTGATGVTFGGVAATSFDVDSSTSISAVVPAHIAGVVDIVVTKSSGAATLAGAFTFVAPPALEVTSVVAAEGSTAGGEFVTIHGIAFTGASAVTFGGTPATSFVVDSSTSISAVAPAHAAALVDVVVTTAAGSATLPAAYLFVAPAPLAVTSISPAEGSTEGGDFVTIHGTAFTGATGVTLGGVAATSFVVDSPTSISAVVPAHVAALVDVVVTTAGAAATLPLAYRFVSPPVLAVTSVSPAEGSWQGGEFVTIHGTVLTEVTGVSFGGVPATSFTVDSSTSISAVIPAHVAALVDVVVTTPGGDASLPLGFTFVGPPVPVIAGVTPAAGPTAGNRYVTIGGSGFTGALEVLFGGFAAVLFTVDSDASISAVIPAHGPAAVDVVVTNQYGTGTLPGGFAFVAPGGPSARAARITAGDSWTMTFLASSDLTDATVTWTATAERGSPDSGHVITKTATVVGAAGSIALLPGDTRSLLGGSFFGWTLRVVGADGAEEAIGSGVLFVASTAPGRAN